MGAVCRSSTSACEFHVSVAFLPLSPCSLPAPSIRWRFEQACTHESVVAAVEMVCDGLFVRVYGVLGSRLESTQYFRLTENLAGVAMAEGCHPLDGPLGAGHPRADACAAVVQVVVVMKQNMEKVRTFPLPNCVTCTPADSAHDVRSALVCLPRRSHSGVYLIPVEGCKFAWKHVVCRVWTEK